MRRSVLFVGLVLGASGCGGAVEREPACTHDGCSRVVWVERGEARALPLP